METIHRRLPLRLPHWVIPPDGPPRHTSWATVSGMTTARRPGPDAPRRRPKDRKAQIAKASADAFSAMGYHGVSMEDIASRVGITAAALYRHSSSKYELFRDAVLTLGQHLVDCTAIAEDITDPQARLDALVDRLAETAIAYRTAGGLYRWEGRYLRDDDQAALMDQIKLVNRRLQQPLAQLRPELTSRERWTLSSAALSVIGSVADHRAQLAVPEIARVLSGLASEVLATTLPTGPLDDETFTLPADSTRAGKYEALLHESLVLFNKQGFRETSMEDIAAAVGIQPSGIYRYFPSKGDILAASYRRAADRVSGDLAGILAETTDPEQALVRLIDAYVARSFRDPELAYVYYTERVNLPPVDRVALRNIQRSTVESWAGLVAAARGDFTPAHARFAVHAALALVVDLGRLVQYDDTEYSRACVRRLMQTALLDKSAVPRLASPPG